MKLVIDVPDGVFLQAIIDGWDREYDEEIVGCLPPLGLLAGPPVEDCIRAIGELSSNTSMTRVL